MKIRLGYSIELEKLMDKFSCMLENNIDPLNKSTKMLQICSDMIKYGGDNCIAPTIVMIDELRKNLASIDEDLAETLQLIGGYNMNVLNAQQQTIEAPEPEQPIQLPRPHQQHHGLLPQPGGTGRAGVDPLHGQHRPGEGGDRCQVDHPDPQQFDQQLDQIHGTGTGHPPH